MLKMSKAIRAKICENALAAYPSEGCGILLGSMDGAGSRTVQEVYFMRNESPFKNTAFFIRTDTMLHAEQAAAKKGYDIVGIYHSHPDCQAVPSASDVRYAVPGLSYPIVSIDNGKVVEMKSFIKTLKENYDHMKQEVIEINFSEQES